MDIGSASLSPNRCPVCKIWNAHPISCYWSLIGRKIYSHNPTISRGNWKLFCWATFEAFNALNYSLDRGGIVWLVLKYLGFVGITKEWLWPTWSAPTVHLPISSIKLILMKASQPQHVSLTFFLLLRARSNPTFDFLHHTSLEQTNLLKTSLPSTTLVEHFLIKNPLLVAYLKYSSLASS